MKKHLSLLSVVVWLFIIAGCSSGNDPDVTSREPFPESQVAESSVESQTAEDESDISSSPSSTESSSRESSVNTTSAGTKSSAQSAETTSATNATSSVSAVSAASSSNQGGTVKKEIKPERLSNIWVCPRSIDYTTGRIFDGFVDGLVDTSNWPNILAHTRVLKLYIQQLYTTPDKDLKRIADFVREQALLVAVELGGVRMASPNVPKENRGQIAFNSEFRHVTHFIELGGRCDYITTDHALAETISGRGGFTDMTMQEVMRQQAVYYKLAQAAVPGLKVGAIESLGFFWVKGKEIQYQSTDPALNRVDFEEYLSELKRICGEGGVSLDHFHIDFNLAEVTHDGGYGRILAVEDYCHSLNLDVSMIVCNAFHVPNVYPTKAVEAAKRSSATRALKLFEGYMQAGGKSDYLLFQRWQYYPMELGSESEPLTTLGIFKSLLDSEWFPNDR